MTQPTTWKAEYKRCGELRREGILKDSIINRKLFQVLILKSSRKAKQWLEWSIGSREIQQLLIASPNVHFLPNRTSNF